MIFCEGSLENLDELRADKYYLQSSDRGSNENTNGLLRQYFPRGTDLSRFSQAYLNKIALRLNQRPRKTLGFETPADKLEAVLH